MSTQAINTYNAADVELIIAGYKVYGWDKISLDRTVPGFTPYAGIRGKDTRVRNNKTSALLSLSIINTCPVNDVLSYVHELDLELGTGRLEITLKDNSGRSVFSTTEAYIMKYPQVEFNSDIGYRVWPIYCQTTSTWLVGGNTKPTTSLFDKITNLASDGIDTVTNLF